MISRFVAKLRARFNRREVHWRMFDARRACEGGAPDETDTTVRAAVTCGECRVAMMLGGRGS